MMLLAALTACDAVSHAALALLSLSTKHTRLLSQNQSMSKSHVGMCVLVTGSRVLAKAHPEERVGVFARTAGRLEVVEYSEMDPAEARSSDPSEGPSKSLPCAARARFLSWSASHVLSSHVA